MTVWAVELGKGVQPDEIKGTLELGDEACSSPRTTRRARRCGSARHREGPSPPRLTGAHGGADHLVGPAQNRVLLRAAAPASLLGAPVERPGGLAAFRNPKRKARRDNVGYLGLMNREKKAALSEWVRAVKPGCEGSLGTGSAAAQG